MCIGITCHHFKGLSIKQITQIFLEGESPTLIPFSGHGYITCNLTKFTHFYCRTAVFNYSYLSYAISEWNKLSPEFRLCKTYLSFRNKLLKLGQPNLFKSKGLKILSCLRLSLNHVNANKFQHKFKRCLKPLCS